ncbi:MAG: alginate export family protein, partial [Deltaproteobacteria bacterium]|nr:alginate export family protein [Deltaproteobacteria bacterium]
GRERFTTGLFLDGTLMPGLSYMAEFYYQGGTIDAGAADITISAMLAALRVGYTAPVWGKPRVEAFFDYLSGDDDPADDKSQSFDTLFATNHKFYGFMDAFLNIPAHTGGLGLMDMGGRAKLVPAKWFNVFLDFHHFATAQDGPDIGQEIDLIANFKVNRFATIQAGFGVFLPAEERGDEVATFGYLMANLAL